ncbi:MAG: inorganic pyrophosphatase Ppa [Desulfosarcina sp.]
MTTTCLQKSVTFEIEKYSPPKDLRSLAKTHVPYSGTAQRHPFDPEQIILIPDPYNPDSSYLKIVKRDITHVEKLATVVNMAGETVAMVRVWVKKGSRAVQCTPFQVSLPWSD